MRTVYQGKTYSFSEPHVIQTIAYVPIIDSLGWFCHPYFLKKCADAGVTMKTFNDLLSWLITHRTRLIEGRAWGTVRDTLGGMIDFHNDEGWCFYDSERTSDSLLFDSQKVTASPSRWLLVPATDVNPTEWDGAWVFRRLISRPVSAGSGYTWMVEPEASEDDSGRSAGFWNKLNNYTFRPQLQFKQLEKERTLLFFGMELELSTRLTILEIQHIVTQVEPRQELFFFFKQDSSITGRYDNRIELVTMPCSPRYLKKNMSTFFHKVEKLVAWKGDHLEDYFDTSLGLNNGLHIHVSANAFVQNSPYDNRHRNKFLTAFNQWDKGFQEWLRKLTKRSTTAFESNYAHIHPGLDGYTLARRVKNGPAHPNRHSACHNNQNTVEVRVFYGWYDINHVVACIELTQAMFYYTQYTPLRSFGRGFAKDFTTWLNKEPGYTKAKEVVNQCA